MWFLETPWPPIALLLLAAFVLVAIWIVSRNPRLALGAILCVVLCGVVYVVEYFYETPGELIESHVTDVIAAFQDKRTDDTLYYFSESAQIERGLIMWGIESITVHDDLRITDVEVQLFSEGSQATSRFRANGTIEGRGFSPVRQPSHWRFTWRLEGGQWKITRVERLDVVTGEPTGLRAPQQ